MALDLARRWKGAAAFALGLPTPEDETAPPPSALQKVFSSHKAPTGTDSHLYKLALQIAHNLRYQHSWTDLRIHLHGDTTENYTNPNPSQTSERRPLPRPTISGLPPRRLYTHPDEQLELLQQARNDGKQVSTASALGAEREREWVLPSHLRERWNLRKFGEVFDALTVVPEAGQGEAIWKDSGVVDVDEIVSARKWRYDKPKRVLLATLDDDSTVVYYIIHDGIVKPRQN